MALLAVFTWSPCLLTALTWTTTGLGQVPAAAMPRKVAERHGVILHGAGSTLARAMMRPSQILPRALGFHMLQASTTPTQIARAWTHSQLPTPRLTKTQSAVMAVVTPPLSVVAATAIYNRVVPPAVQRSPPQWQLQCLPCGEPVTVIIQEGACQEGACSGKGLLCSVSAKFRSPLPLLAPV